jgi:cell division septation protein DedD
MHRHLTVAVCAVLAAAALGLSGCSPGESKVARSGGPSALPPMSSGIADPATAPLPPPEAVTGVLSRLVDPNVPGTDKVNLIEGATSDSAPIIDKFTNALRDNGYMPMTFTATNMTWSDKNPTDVMATINVNSTGGNNGIFNFPMEFTPFQGGWQVSQQTADMLLALGNSSSTPPPAPSQAPAPAPPPAPGSAPAPAPAPPPAPSPAPPPGPSPTPSP